MPDEQFTLIPENFRHARNFLRLNGVRRIDGMLADLGVSSHQFDEGARGFSTRFDDAFGHANEPTQRAVRC